MLTVDSLTVTPGRIGRHVPVALMFVLMPLVGLSYIILLPFLGIVLFILASRHRALEAGPA